MNEAFFFNIILFVMGSTLCVTGSVYVLLGAKMDKRLDRIFLLVSACLVMFGLAALGRQYFNGKQGPNVHALMNICCFGEFYLSFFMVFLASCYLYSLLEPGYRIFTKVAVFLLAVHTALLVVSVFNGFFYTIDAANRYSRGPGYVLCYFSAWILMMIDFYLLIFRAKNLRREEKFAFIIYLILPLASVVVQIAIPGINFGFLAGTLALFFLYFYILSSRKEQYYEREKENTKMKIDVLMAQIQPHFLFNSLSVIKSVCRQSPELAEKAIGEFAEYLRYNMNSLTREQKIPFENELDHIKQYLDLQKLRFGDDLKVQYNLNCTEFSIPPLTIQPLVENAVTHGIRRSESGRGTVSVSTREYPDHIEIEISDDGAGFDIEAFESGKQENPQHQSVGVRNARSRLAEMAGGRLEIKSVPGKGTTATVVLPKRGN